VIFQCKIQGVHSRGREAPPVLGNQDLDGLRRLTKKKGEERILEVVHFHIEYVVLTVSRLLCEIFEF